MFDNIIGQKTIIKTLKTEIRDGTLPPAVLFYGPPNSGKLSSALETARVLTCEKKNADWSCDCHSCARHRLLLHPNLLLLGYRDFSVEIAASAYVFMQTKKISSKFLFIRSVRKLLKRYDPILCGEDNAKVKKNESAIQDIEEFLNAIEERKDFSGDFPHQRLKEITALCQKISGISKTENIPIDHIRKAMYWVHLSSSETNKIIIIEKADKMLESSRNSILKLLEEPPENVYIILLTSRKGAIIKTILSRLRQYHFFERTRDETKHILTKIFKEKTGEFHTLREYFLSWQNLNPAVLKSLAHKYIGFILQENSSEPDILEEMAELFAFEPKKTAFISFAEELTSILREVLHNICFKHIGFEQIEKWAEILRDSLREYELYNINPKNVIEKLYYKMKAVV